MCFTSPDECTFSKGGITNGRGKVINENRIEATYELVAMPEFLPKQDMKFLKRYLA